MQVMQARALKKVVKGELINPRLIRLLPESGIILIAGGIGSGKSALAYSLLEFFSCKYDDVSIYLYGFPEKSEHLLPNWINILREDDNFPENCVLLVDEAYIQWSSRESMSKKSKLLDKFVGLVRQKDMLCIFISQSFRKMEIGVLTSTDLLLIKRLPYLQVELDRSQLRPKLKTVAEKFSQAKKVGFNPKKCVYAISNQYEYDNIIYKSNDIPTFWTEELSKSWGGTELQN